MNEVKLLWITPNAEQVITDCARVSNPTNQGKDGKGLIKYCVRNSHWSVFEMANMCLSVKGTRDITRQLLRHRSFSFQEFSQRYAEVSPDMFCTQREARLQDLTNRQNSIQTDDTTLQNSFEWLQQQVQATCQDAYQQALKAGIAKEQARAFLPEGLTMSHLYVNGTIRSWIHYVKLREGNGTQKEHIEIAQQAKAILIEQIPVLKEVL